MGAASERAAEEDVAAAEGGGGSRAVVGVPGAHNEPAANDSGEKTPCATSSARRVASEAESAAAAFAASATVFGVLNESVDNDESVPKMRGGAIGGRGVVDDAFPSRRCGAGECA